MDLGIRDLPVLVTAGADGIGRAIAEAFAREGARVHICNVDTIALGEFRKTHPAITASLCDVGERRDVAELFAETLAQLGGLVCLVNNAGISGPNGRIDEINPEDWDHCLKIDLTG